MTPTSSHSLHGVVVSRMVRPFGFPLEAVLLAVATVLPAAQPFFFLEGVIPLVTRLAAAALWVACLAPSWHYLTTPVLSRRPIPLLPLIGLLYGLYFALPVLLDAELLYFGVWIDPARDYGPAVEIAALGWGGILIGYGALCRARPWRMFDAMTPSDVSTQRWAARLIVFGLVVRLLMVTVPAAQALAGLAVFMGSLATFGLAVLVMAWRQGRLVSINRVLVVASVFILGMLEVASGAISGLLLLFLILGLAYWAASPARVGLLAVVAFVICVSFAITFKGVLQDFRQTTWTSDSNLDVVERAELAGQLFQSQITAEGPVGALTSGSNVTASRSSNADLLAEVIRRTPSNIPFWDGHTYLSLVGAFVPRLLWPDKPVKDLGQEFGHRYGYLDPSDQSTSINFPWLVEAYANFGRMGVAVVCILIGTLYATLFRLVNIPGQSLWTTAAGIVAMTPLFNIESDLSLTFGGLPLTLGALWIVMRWISQADRHRWSTS